LVLFWGRFLLPIPFRHDLLMVVGNPIPVTQTENPSPQQVEELHSTFTQALQRLFDDHKHLVQWQSKSLVIL